MQGARSASASRRGRVHEGGSVGERQHGGTRGAAELGGQRVLAVHEADVGRIREQRRRRRLVRLAVVLAATAAWGWLRVLAGRPLNPLAERSEEHTSELQSRQY